MNSLFEYLLMSSSLLLILGIGYWVLLRNQKLFLFTRLYLLNSLLLSLLYPFLPKIGNLIPEQLSQASPMSLVQADRVLPELVLSAPAAEPGSMVHDLLLAVYLAGVALALLRFLLRLNQLRRQLQCLSFQVKPEGYLLAHTTGDAPTFSFFCYLVINPTHTTTEEEYQLVLRHEQAHARQHHSIDILLAELAQIVLWFHPGTYLLSKALRQTHEHLADAAVLQTPPFSAAENRYIALMAKRGLAAAGLPFSSTFFQSFTINRIRMIKKRTSPSRHWRIAACFTIAASLAAFIACDKQQELQELPSPPPPVAIDSNTPARGEETNPLSAASADASVTDMSLPPLPPFSIVDEDARPQGGWTAFYEQLHRNIKYSKEALNKKVEGTTFISLRIDNNGNVASADIIESRTVGYGLDEEVIRVLKTTKWIPAKKEGKATEQLMNLPVKFESGSEKASKKQTSLLFKELLKTPEKAEC